MTEPQNPSQKVGNNSSSALSSSTTLSQQSQQNQAQKQQKQQATLIPDSLNPMQGATTVDLSMRFTAPRFKRQERELFEMAMVLEGVVEKKSTSLIVGYQKKFLRVFSQGAYLAYYDKEPPKGHFSQTTGDSGSSLDEASLPKLVPNGCFMIHGMSHIESRKKKLQVCQLHFHKGRIFEFATSRAVEAQLWVICLKFLNEHASDVIGWQESKPEKYFTNYTSVVKHREEEDDVSEEEEEDNEQDYNQLAEGNASTAAAVEGRHKNNTHIEDKDQQTEQMMQMQLNNPAKGAANRMLGKSSKKKQTKQNKKDLERQKFANIDAEAFSALIRLDFRIGLNYDRRNIVLSRRALVTKSLWGYLKSMNPDLMRNRVMFGFLRKRSKGRLKVYINRWYFLISSRPLNIDDFVNDDRCLCESELPPLLEFDTIYYYYMDDTEDESSCQGQIKTGEIVYINRKRPSSTETGYSFILDTGGKKHHLNSKYLFEVERWVQAIYISAQTARESRSSLNPQIKNISKLIISFECGKEDLRQQIESQLNKRLSLDVDDWEEDTEELLEKCSEVREDLITTFDACLAQPTRRTDIVNFLMELTHAHLITLMGSFWESLAINLNPYETLCLIDWAHCYNNELALYGCRDDLLYNGFLTLCNTYALKIHSQLVPLILNILKGEAGGTLQTDDYENYDGCIFTSAPRDLIKLFDEAFQVVRVKKIKQLMLKMLHVYQEITFQYQGALQKFYETPRKKPLNIEFLIAQCNNYFLFWQVFQDLINPMIDEGIATDEEIQEHFSERIIIQKFNKLQDALLTEITDRVFKPPSQSGQNSKTSKNNPQQNLQMYKPLGQLFNQPFLDLGCQQILNLLMETFEELAEFMEEKTKRSAWTKFLERTVFYYIQCLLNGSGKIKQQQPSQVINKIKADHRHINARFEPHMTKRARNSGLEVLDDLVSFFECSPEFISVPCEKLRRTQGSQFSKKIVNALMSLRTNLDRAQKKQAIELCEEILINFKDDPSMINKNQGLFKLQEENMQGQQSKGGETGNDASKKKQLDSQTDSDMDDDDDIGDMQDFLNEGGLAHAVEEEKKAKEKEKIEERKQQRLKDGLAEETPKNADQIQNAPNTDPNPEMEGFLTVQKQKLKKESSNPLDLLKGKTELVSKVFTSEPFFVIRGTILYQFDRKRARVSEDQYDLAKIRAIQACSKDLTAFQMIYKNFYCTFQTQSESICQKWINSIKYVKENLEELDLKDYGQNKNMKRYVKLKVYERITIKSAFKDYSILMELHQQKTMLEIFLKGCMEVFVKTAKHGFDKIMTETEKKQKFANLVNHGKSTPTTINPAGSFADSQHSKGSKNSRGGTLTSAAGMSSFRGGLQIDQYLANVGLSGKKEHEMRRKLMMDFEQTKDLLYKMDPGQLDLYDACFGSEGLMGELIMLIEKKAREMLDLRIQLGKDPIESPNSLTENNQIFNQEGGMLKKSKTLRQTQINGVGRSEFCGADGRNLPQDNHNNNNLAAQDIIEENGSYYDESYDSEDESYYTDETGGLSESNNKDQNKVNGATKKDNWVNIKKPRQQMQEMKEK